MITKKSASKDSLPYIVFNNILPGLEPGTSFFVRKAFYPLNYRYSNVNTKVVPRPDRLTLWQRFALPEGHYVAFIIIQTDNK